LEVSASSVIGNCSLNPFAMSEKQTDRSEEPFNFGNFIKYYIKT